MRRGWYIVTAVVAVGLLSSMAWAYPTRFGPATGLVDLPTADVGVSGGAELAVDYTKLQSDQQVWPVRLLVAASDNAEIGVAWARLKDGVNEDLMGVGGKVVFMQEPEADLGVAVGASYLNGVSSNTLEIYAVATKELSLAARGMYQTQTAGPRLRGHLGVMFTRLNDGVDDNETKPFVGFDVTTADGTSFVAEYKWTKFGDDHAAAAIRYPLSPAVTVQAGVARAGTVLGQDDYRFIIGFNYSFVAPGGSAESF